MSTNSSTADDATTASETTSSSITSSLTTSLSTSTEPPTTSSSSSTSTEPPTTSSSSTSSAPPPTTSSQSTQTSTASSAPPVTSVFTSVRTVTPTSPGDTNTQPITQVVTVTRAPTADTSSTPTSASSSTTTTPATLNGGTNDGKSGGGLSTAGITAVAVVVPVVVVALLVLGGIFLWRRRKQRRAAEDARRKEVEDYGFNPNNDPTLPTVASESGQAMSEDHSSGYRGWGAATASNRKMSTTLSNGHTQGQLSDAGSNPYRGAASPTGGNSDGNSGDAMLHQRRETMNSDDLGSLGHAPAAGAAVQGGMKRGPSNASSTYSAGAHSDVSDGPPPAGVSDTYDPYQPNNGYGYSQHGPYGDGTYGGAAQQENGMPIVRDVSARRNTRIQQPGNYQQGNSGISQNF